MIYLFFSFLFFNIFCVEFIPLFLHLLLPFPSPSFDDYHLKFLACFLSSGYCYYFYFFYSLIVASHIHIVFILYFKTFFLIYFLYLLFLVPSFFFFFCFQYYCFMNVDFLLPFLLFVLSCFVQLLICYIFSFLFYLLSFTFLCRTTFFLLRLFLSNCLFRFLASPFYLLLIFIF